jgi:four helix bundle protein
MNDLNLNVKTKYDLAERTEKFGVSVIDFARLIPKDVVTLPLISQFVRSGTSMGANYCEADGAESKKDFKHKIGICKKESKETKYWLKIIMKAVPELTEEAKRLWQEAQELTLIFSSIYKKC